MRTGLDEEELERKVAPLDRKRDGALRRLADPTDTGEWCASGIALAHRLVTNTLAIQPGIADDLPALLSSSPRKSPGLTPPRPAPRLRAIAGPPRAGHRGVGTRLAGA